MTWAHGIRRRSSVQESVEGEISNPIYSFPRRSRGAATTTLAEELVEILTKPFALVTVSL